MNGLLNFAVFISSLVVGLFYVVCRLNFLRFTHHRLAVVLFHWAMTVIAFSAATHAWAGDAGIEDVASLVAAATWLITSWPSWGASKTPAHTRKHHVRTHPQPKSLP